MCSYMEIFSDVLKMYLGKLTFHVVNCQHKDNIKTKVLTFHWYLDEGTQLSQIPMQVKLPLISVSDFD